jgi:hypothetical protein
MSNYKFGHPYVYDDWYIFPGTTLDNIKLDDCPSSVTGTCEDTKTVEDCIKLCQDNQPCFAGYFIETPDKHNICVPIRKIYRGPSIGPYYRLRNKNIYPELKNMKSYVFTNKTSYKYPPDHGNSIFYTDKFVLTNLASQKSIGTEENGNIVPTDILTSYPVFLQFLPQEILRSYVSQYLVVKNGDEVVVNIPNTAYILENDGKNINWVMKLVSLGGPNTALHVFSTDKNKKIGDFLNYSDTLYFTNGSQPLVYDSELNILKIDSANIDNVDPANTYFKITPKIQGYYCEENQCKQVMLENTEMDQEKSRYKGVTVNRNPNCWGACNKVGSKSLWILYLVLFLVIATVLLFVFRKKL